MKKLFLALLLGSAVIAQAANTYATNLTYNTLSSMPMNCDGGTFTFRKYVGATWYPYDILYGDTGYDWVIKYATSMVDGFNPYNVVAVDGTTFSFSSQMKPAGVSEVVAASANGPLTVTNHGPNNTTPAARFVFKINRAPTNKYLTGVTATYQYTDTTTFNLLNKSYVNKPDWSTAIPQIDNECFDLYVDFCGDGVKNGAEVCDDGAQNGQPGKCSLSCNGVPPPPTPGVCSSSVTGPQSSPLTTGSCNIGSVAGFTSVGTNPVNYSWTCNGLNGGAASSTCTASYTPPPPPVNGVCSSTVTGPQSSPLTNGSCNVGSVVGFTSVGTNPVNYSWTCSGQNGGSASATCNASYNAPPPPVNGVCSSTVTGPQSSPLTNGSCNVGSVVGFTSVGTNPVNYSWTCSGQNGGSASATCNASYNAPPPPVNGVCSSTVTGPQSSPLTTGSCNIGSVAGFTSVGTNPVNYSWTCNGLNGGAASSTCSASYTPPPPPTPGVCSSSVTGPQSSPLTTGSCNIGSVAGFTSVGTNPVNYSWTCNGLNGGAASSTCTASYTPPPPPVNGVCSSTVTGPQSSPLTNGSCNVGSVVGFTSVGTNPVNYSWTCSGQNGGSASATCNASYTLPPTPGICGPANGTTTTTAPVTGLCSAGSATPVTGSGPWNWSCTGANGGATATCSANPPPPTPGICGPANGTTTTTAPVTGLCSAGSATPVTGSGPWNWSCTGANGGATATCNANPPSSGSGFTLSIKKYVDCQDADTLSGAFVVDPGQLITYYLRVTNQGPGPVTGITTVTDDIPAGVSYTGASSFTVNGWSCNYSGTRMTCTSNATPAAGTDFLDITFPVIVTATSGSVINIGTVSNPGSGTTGHEHDPGVITIRPICDASKSGPQSAPLTNGYCTRGTASGFTVTGVNLINYSWTCNNDAIAVSCNANYIPACAPGCTGTGSPLLNIKKAAAGLDGQTLADAAQVAPGSPFNYTYTVSNTGSGSATGVTVTDTFPRYVSVTAVPTGTDWTCSRGTKVVSGVTYHTVICTYNKTLAAGATAPVITVPALVDAATPEGTALRNIAYVCSTGNTSPECNPGCTDPANPTCTPPPPPPNCDGADTGANKDPACVVTGRFNLSVKKYVDSIAADAQPGSPVIMSPGQAFNYIIRVTNLGPGSTTGTTTITDTLPVEVTPNGTAYGSGWTCSGTTSVSCSSTGIVASGSSFPDIYIPVRISGTASGSFTNTGIVSNPNSGTRGNDRDPAVIVIGTGKLNIKKAAAGLDGQTLADAAQVAPGSPFNYTYTVSNTGSGSATGVTVTDTFPRYVSVTAVPTGTDWTCSRGTKVVSGVTYHTVICTYNKTLAAGATAPVITVPALVDAATPEGTALRNIAYVCSTGNTSPECNPGCTDPANPTCTPPPPPPNCDGADTGANKDPACVVTNNVKRCDVLSSSPSASTLAPASSVSYTCTPAGSGIVLANLEYRIMCGSSDTSATYGTSNTKNCTLPNSYGASQTVTCSVRDKTTSVVYSGSDAGSCSVTKSTTGGGGGGGGSSIYYIPKCVNGIAACSQYVANSLAECNAANGGNCMSHAQCDPVGISSLTCSGGGGGGGGGYCGDGVLQPSSGEECDIGFSSSISADKRWCGQPGEVDASGNAIGCRIRITTNPGANPITGLWMTVPRLSNARIGNSQLDVVPGNPNLGRVNFASYQMVLGINTQAFTLADTVGFGIKTGEPLALAIPKNKYFCLGTAGTALNSNSICTAFGALADSSYETFPNVAEPGNPYILIGDGYYQYPSTRNADGTWNYVGGNASSPNNIDLFRGPTTYGSNTLANAFRGMSLGTDNITLYHYSSVGGLPIDLVTLPVKVASPMVGTSSTTLSRSSLTTFMNSRSVLTSFLSHFSNSTTTSTVTTSAISTSTGAANVISLGANNAPVAGLIVNGTGGLESYKLNGNNNVYAVKGNVTLNCTSGVTATPLSGVKTLVVENGDLTINCNNTYPASDTTSSWAFIVKGGSIKIANSVTNLVGVYVTIPEASVGGKYLSLEGSQTNNIITINGSLYGDASDLFSKRNYLRGTNAYDTLTTGVILSYSNRALVSPPPLLSQYLNNYTVTRVVR